MRRGLLMLVRPRRLRAGDRLADPIWTVPQGVRLHIDPAASTLTFPEPAVT
jgi:hypothetical protein